MNSTLRVVLFFAIILYFFLVVHLLKKRRLDLKYTLLWLILGVVMIVFVAAPKLMTMISSLFGIAEDVNTLFLIAIAAITIILMALTSIVSGQKDAIRKLVQANGLLENRVRELEKALKKEE